MTHVEILVVYLFYMLPASVHLRSVTLAACCWMIGVLLAHGANYLVRG